MSNRMEWISKNRGVFHVFSWMICATKMRTLRQPARNMISMRWCVYTKNVWKSRDAEWQNVTNWQTKARRFVQRALQCIPKPCALAAKSSYTMTEHWNPWLGDPTYIHLSRNDHLSMCLLSCVFILCLCVSIHSCLSWSFFWHLNMQTDRQIDRFVHISHTLELIYPRI